MKMTKKEMLEMDRDTILEHIETINALIYEDAIAIERLQAQISELDGHF